MVWSYISERRHIGRAFRSEIGKTAVIYPAALLVATGVGMVILGVIFLVNEVFGATPGQIGRLYAAWSFCYVFGCLALRPVSARMLPRYSMLLATTLMCICMYGLLQLRSLAPVYIVYGAFGLSASFFWPPMMGWLSANVEGDQLNRAMGRFNLCWSTGMIISPLLAGWLSEVDPRLPVRVGALLFLATSCLILGAILTLSSLARDDAAHAEERAPRKGPGQGTVLRYPAWLGVFTVFAVYGAILNVFPIAAQTDLHVSKKAVGTILFGRALMNTIGLGAMGRTRFWHFRSGQMVAGLLLFGAAALCLASARSLLAVALLLALMGLFAAHGYSNSLFHGVSGSVRRSARMALHEALLSGGAIFGAMLGGCVYDRWGMTAVYLFCAAILFASAAGQLTLIRCLKPQDCPPGQRRR